jgi:hypothetical protein
MMIDCKWELDCTGHFPYLLLSRAKANLMNSTIQEIPLADFDLSLSGMRIMNPTRIRQVEKSMRLHGQLHPVVARVHEQGAQLVDGLKRLFAAETCGMKALQSAPVDGCMGGSPGAA